MFGRRDFEEDSSSSFEAEDPGTPPPVYQQEHQRSNFDHEFDLDPKPKTSFYTGNPGKTGPIGVQPVKKETNEKIGFINFVEEPEPVYDRPATVARPGSSSAQMRQKMMEAKKKQLMDRPGGTVVVGTGGLLGSMKMDSAQLDNPIYSGGLLSEKDLSGNKGLKPFTSSGITFEPNVSRNPYESLPGPIKPEITVIGREDLDEEVLDERSATKSEPSQILKEMHKKIELKNKPKIEEPPVHRPEPNLIKAKEVKSEVEVPKVEQNHFVMKEEVYTKGKEEDVKAVAVAETKKPEAKEEVRPVPRAPAVNIREILNSEMRDMRKFLTTPVRKGIMLQCSIRRDKSGFSRLFPKYFMQTSEGLNFLLAGKKRAGNRTSNYMVTCDQKDFNTKSPSFLAKVRSNFLGTEFMVYDSGLNPKRRGANPSNVRTELGIVLYVTITQESNIMGSKGPRKMHVLAPATQESGESSIWKPMNVKNI